MAGMMIILMLMAIVSMMMMMAPNHQETTWRAPSMIVVTVDIADIRLLLFSLKGALRALVFLQCGYISCNCQRKAEQNI